jgi:hypothetical protein
MILQAATLLRSQKKSRGTGMRALYRGNSDARVTARALRPLWFVAMAILGMAIGQDAAAQSTAENVPPIAPKLFFEGDMVLAQACVLNNRFRRNEGVVWRVRVLDPETGQQVDAKSLKSLVIELADGQTIPMKHGGHPRGGTDDRFWSTSWKVPENYPTGTFAYTVVATDLNGEVTRWQPFAIKMSQLTIVDE